MTKTKSKFLTQETNDAATLLAPPFAVAFDRRIYKASRSCGFGKLHTTFETSIQKFLKFQKFNRPSISPQTPKTLYQISKCHPVVVKAVAARAAVVVKAAVGRVEVGRALAICLLLRLQ
jgi:hypothetical protein